MKVPRCSNSTAQSLKLSPPVTILIASGHDSHRFRSQFRESQDESIKQSHATIANDNLEESLVDLVGEVEEGYAPFLDELSFEWDKDIEIEVEESVEDEDDEEKNDEDVEIDSD
ncbi:hypothetical protein P8452_52481 [Trifolium repens]|nr:hypothetical protein P8452_52481 [Trifolium repens]